LEPEKIGSDVYNFLNDVFDRTFAELHSAERTFNECMSYKKYMSEQQCEVIESHFHSIKKTLKTIQDNPLT
tara:strand:+ start:260 stop:472 length:213 start_codon:yes stop_codon:yes gene_type:complete